MKNQRKRIKHLTSEQVYRLIDASNYGRHSERNQLMLRLAYRHGMRSAELLNLTFEQIDFDKGIIEVWRCKGSADSRQPLHVDDLAALKQIDRSQAFVFLSERGSKMDHSQFWRIVKEAARRAGLKDVHPHTLRHACGFELAEQDKPLYVIAGYLGHRNIQNTMTYIALADNRFASLKNAL